MKAFITQQALNITIIIITIINPVVMWLINLHPNNINDQQPHLLQYFVNYYCMKAIEISMELVL